ncbi:hypothetical protein Maes01_01290 [Microbulbifer aestuariivivens]|uniref:CENP-V/GFA domain-containing protein n=1 Tax=Microbulbifer aestuariivivens TaxID=1908308 RepID=A0ABP9WNE4_9GAMM
MGQTKWAVSGGCHCGAVRFQASIVTGAGDGPVAHECNCSICRMLGFQHLIVAAQNFELVKGADALSRYAFNTGVAKHLFCRHCGVKSFYVPRSNPDGYSLNLRCLDEVPEGTRIEPFDGQHWEAHASGLTHLSQVGNGDD